MKLLRWLFGAKHYEIKIVLATLAVLICLPIVSVVVLATSGFAVAGNALAAINPVTHLVELFDPNGKKTSEVQLSTVWPTKGYVSDTFGSYEPWRKALGLGPHTGLDIANNFGLFGDPITPFLEGKVIEVDPLGLGTCGVYVKIQHSNNLKSLYCHMTIALAIKYQDVKPGDTIGLMGSTGESTGPHLHFQVTVYDIPVDPRTFMVGDPERSVPVGILKVVI